MEQTTVLVQKKEKEPMDDIITQLEKSLKDIEEGRVHRVR